MWHNVCVQIFGVTVVLKKKFNISDISEVAVDRSALALVNGNPWDMHRPLQEECSLELIHFHDRDPFHLNKAFWRSCSFLLGYACQAVFSQHIPLQLHSFPPPNGKLFSYCTNQDINFQSNFQFKVAVLSMISISVGTNGTPPKKS